MSILVRYGVATLLVLIVFFVMADLLLCLLVAYERLTGLL